MKRLRTPFRDHRAPTEGHFAVRWRVDCGTSPTGPEPTFKPDMLLPGYYAVDAIMGPYSSHEMAREVAKVSDAIEEDGACFWGWSDTRKPQFPRTDSERPARNPLFIVNGPWDQRHPMVRLAAAAARAGQKMVVGQ